MFKITLNVGVKKVPVYELCRNTKDLFIQTDVDNDGDDDEISYVSPKQRIKVSNDKVIKSVKPVPSVTR